MEPRWALWAERTLPALPFLVLGYAVLLFVRNGIDLPYWDDWRDYVASTLGTLAPSYLFRPANDTLYPVGKFLDSVMLDVLNGNTLVYQTLSMIAVLGLLLVLTWKLLLASLDDRLLAACAFVPMLLALQIDSYWGRQYIAYHQTIPLVCLLAALLAMTKTAWPVWARSAAGFVLGLIAGLAYISGAVAGLAAAIALIAIGLLRPSRRDLLQAGCALGAAAILTTIAQAYVIVVVQHGGTHSPGTPWATPLSADFWLYAMGKVARSLALPVQYPLPSLAIAAAAAGVTGWIVIHALFVLARRWDVEEKTENRLIVTITLAAALFAYLLIVAAGRTNMRLPSIDTPLEVFTLGFARFHFFWLTLIWPWVFAAVLVLAKRASGNAVRPVAVATAALIAGAIACSGALGYRRTFAEENAVKAQGIACIQNALLTSNKIVCPSIYPAELTYLYAQALRARASFVYAVPPTLRMNNPAPRFTVLPPDQFTQSAALIKNAETGSWTGNAVDLVARSDVSLIFVTKRPGRMKVCTNLVLRADVSAAADETAQFFFLPKGQTDFDDAHSAVAPVAKGAPVEIEVFSATGFENRLRFDPIMGAGKVRVANLTVKCLAP